MSTKDIECFVKALCGDDGHPLLIEQARIIANNNLILRAISEQQLAAVDRLREPSAVPLATGDNRIALAKKRLQKSRLAYAELLALRKKLLAQHKEDLPPPGDFEEMDDSLIPYRFEKFLREKERTESQQQNRQVNCGQAAEEIVERDELAAYEAAAVDLVHLDRYERRTWSRQKRALGAFINLKLMRRLQG